MDEYYAHHILCQATFVSLLTALLSRLSSADAIHRMRSTERIGPSCAPRRLAPAPAWRSEQFVRCTRHRATPLGLRTFTLPWLDGPYLRDLARMSLSGPWLQRFVPAVSSERSGTYAGSLDRTITHMCGEAFLRLLIRQRSRCSTSPLTRQCTHGHRHQRSLNPRSQMPSPSRGRASPTGM